MPRWPESAPRAVLSKPSWLPFRVRLGTTLAGALLLGLIWTGPIPYDTTPRDSHAYWAVDAADLYAGTELGEPDAYLYSPAFAQVIGPLRELPFETFRALWAAIGLASLAAIGGLPLLVFLPVIEDLVRGNVHVLTAAAIVAGLRWPVAWAFPILTKVTPGIGVLWFVFRGQWRAAGIALLGTAVVIGLSVLLGGVDPWLEWLAVLRHGTDTEGLPSSAIAPPLAIRLPLAAVIVAWGARTDRPWTVPIGVLVSLPVIWPSSWALLVASLVLLDPMPRRQPTVGAA